MVARIGVKDNQFYSSPKCSVQEDAGINLYDLFDWPRKECLVYLDSTNFTQARVLMTIYLIAEVTPGLSRECNIVFSSRVSFTVQFCEPGDNSDPICLGPILDPPPPGGPVWIALAVLSALVLILIAVLGYRWWNGYFG